jgi:hypothetical protein
VDLASQVAEAINAWLESLVTAILAPSLAAAGQLLFSTPAFDAIPQIQRSWELVRNVADALFVVVFMAAGVLVMTSGGTDSRYTAKVLVPRVVLAAVLANASLAICGALIRVNNALVTGLLGPTPGASAVTALAQLVTSGQAGNQVLGIVIGLAAAVLAVLLVVLFIGRDLVLLVATVMAPLALATYALPQTEELARLWWRVFGALLFVQVGQAVLVQIGAELVVHGEWLGGPVPGLVSGLVGVTVLYLLLKLPFAAYRWAFRQAIGQTPLVRSILVHARALRAA